MKISFFILSVFLLFPIAILSQTTPIRSDFQIWNDTSVTFPLIKSQDKKGKEFDRLTFSINGTLRFGRNVSRPVDERIGFGFNYRVNKYVSFTPDTLYRGTQPYQGRKDYESRFRFAVNLENKWKNFSLVDRNQIEYRLRNSRRDAVRYKNRLRLNVPILKDKKELFTPFVSDEPYYDFQADAWNRNELFVGIGKKINNNFSTDIFYLFVKDTGFPKTVNGIGINLKIKVQ